jgi:hypothetical protein
MADRRRLLPTLWTAVALSILALCGCGSMMGYSMGRIVDTQFSRATPPPACGKHPLRQGQRVTIVQKDGTKRDGLYQWHDCLGDSLLVMNSEISSWDMPGRRSDTLRVPLRSIDQVRVPREGARYVGLVAGMVFDVLIGFWTVYAIGLAGVGS